MPLITAAPTSRISTSAMPISFGSTERRCGGWPTPLKDAGAGYEFAVCDHCWLPAGAGAAVCDHCWLAVDAEGGVCDHCWLAVDAEGEVCDHCRSEGVVEGEGENAACCADAVAVPAPLTAATSSQVWLDTGVLAGAGAADTSTGANCEDGADAEASEARGAATVDHFSVTEEASGEADKVTGSRVVKAVTGVNCAACCDGVDERG